MTVNSPGTKSLYGRLYPLLTAYRAENSVMWLSVIKFPIACFVMGSGLFGFTAYSQQLTPKAFVIGGALFLLSSGAAAMNNVQDRYVDRCFLRTASRPLAVGRISVRSSLLVAITSILASVFMMGSDYRIVFVGVFAVIVYNGIYTPLKKISGWAVLPGLLCGMLPPFIGWLAAGGNVLSVRIWMIMAIFVLWQIPHLGFLLLTYRKDYCNNHLPTLLDRFDTYFFQKSLMIWVYAFGAVSLWLPFIFNETSTWISGMVLGNYVILIVIFGRVCLKRCTTEIFRRLFMVLNCSMGMIMGGLILGTAI